MTDHSDLIERLLRTPDRNALTQNTCQAQNSLLIDAAFALSSQSLSLSEARAENDRKDAEIERLKGLVAGIRECPKEPPGVLCYVAHGRAWFTTAPLDKQWGDDWDDAPYEHNAGSPYSEPGITLTAIAFDAGDLVTPEHEQLNSSWSVQDINAGRMPWLRSSPYGSGTARIMAGATFREFQQTLLAAGGTALMPWPVKEADALRAEISRLEAMAPLSARETARYLEVERRLMALETSKASLADATNDPADLSSLRKGAEVAVKPLEWRRPPTNITLSRADTILGSYAVWTHHEADGDWYWSGPPMPDNSTVCGAVASEGEAKSAAQSDFETRIRSALVSSREDGDG